MLVFVEGGKPENLEKTNNKLNSHRHQAGIVPRPSLRSKCFCGVWEQRKTEERDFQCFSRALNGREPKKRERGWGRGRKETLADKPLDFETAHFFHVRVRTCRHRLSESLRTHQNMSETTSSWNGGISMNPSDQCSF